VALLGAGGLLTLAPRVMETAESFGRLGSSFPKSACAMRGVAKWGGGATGAAVGVTALITGLTALYNASRDTIPEVEELADAILRLQETGDVGSIDEKFQFSGIIAQVDGFADAVGRLDLSNPVRHIQSFGDTVMG